MKSILSCHPERAKRVEWIPPLGCYAPSVGMTSHFEIVTEIGFTLRPQVFPEEPKI